MQWTSLNELREKYLSFFESKGHLRLGSFSLVPNNDKSLLLINSGMAPMKKYFTGEVTPPRNRVTTCQKCIRTPDLERVGHTARHGTYFEMLGNFSFGDYFKEEAIQWAWEFLTKTLEIPENLLWPSIYEEDDEAYAIWKDKIGVDENHIVRLGKEDNFWEHGTGPCGPCSEIYFDRGIKYGCGSPDCKPGCECDRYMEIWNNVFSQFNNMGDGTYTELEHKNIDTGMGLERLACVMQGVDNMFEVDTIRNIINKVCEISGKTYGDNSENDISIRAITDHSRAATFMISDGIMPSNEGRGYVLRRLIRRAARHGRMLGIKRPFLVEMCDAVIKENVNAYTELGEKETLIKKVLSTEEAAFSKTIDQGLAIINELTKNGGVVSGEDAFRLYDTYGFPLDLTKDILSEKNMSVDEDTFNELMQQQRQKAREGRKESDAESWKSDGISFDAIDDTAFVGYTDEVCSSKIAAIVVEGEQSGAIKQGQKGIIALDTTCFYAESGGQVGDTGIIENENGCFVVENTTKNGGVFMHFGTMEKGFFSVQDEVKGVIDTARRNATKRNHTAAHLLQAGLRKVLGTHVEQAGQLVNDKAVRFDFTHFSAMTEDEINEVETFVNAVILSGIEVINREMPIEEAKKMGAMALFGEKYGDVVRVVAVGDKSVELCGGTHIDNSAKIGLFRIISESGIASGVRRIEAVTGTGVLDTLIHYKDIIDAAAAAQKCGNFEELAVKTAALVAESREKDKKIAELEAKLAGGKLDDIVKNAVVVGEISVVAAVLQSTGSEELKNMAEKVKGDNPKAIAVFAGINEGKLTFCAACGKEAISKGANAGSLVRSVAEIAGGKGGGRPDFAMAGGKEISLAGKAIEAVIDLVKNQIGE
ncbi:MAG: alanine--tRNA ligase [Acutalibacteraceae bacterium]|nr:alanine--tRNA ligase [Acutalibacteraceae bacterium]